jgi:inner membrane protein yjfL
MLAGIAMTVVFGAVYLRITPVEELRLIKNGNLACALSFGGTLVGFCLTLASSIAHSVSFIDFILWGFAAAVIQIFVYFAATMMIKGATAELIGNNVAVGALFGAVSISIGILNAACLT